jgi:nicotinamide phosphoribosyltransferase
MMTGGKDDELETFAALLDEFPTGIISIVSDTWDLWKVCTEYLPKLKDKILNRTGKVVIRPDSGDPADIICGLNTSSKSSNSATKEQQKGVVELLYDTFGGKVNSKGYIELDPHIGCIYGDAITREVCTDICERLKTKRFASTNWVAGIGSYTYNYNTRDTLGMAIKATHCRVKDVQYVRDDNGEPQVIHSVIDREIFKDPITDNSGKKSAKGLLAVHQDENGELYLKEQCTIEEYNKGLLEPVFEDGKLLREESLSEIRQRLDETLFT